MNLHTAVNSPYWAGIQKALEVITNKKATAASSLEASDLVQLLSDIRQVLSDNPKQETDNDTTTSEISPLFQSIPNMLEFMPKEVVVTFFQRTLSEICHDMLHIVPQYYNHGTTPIPFLYQSIPQTISFTPIEAFHLICMCFLGIPLIGYQQPNNTIVKTDTMTHFFDPLHSQVGKLTCLFMYFNMIIAAKYQEFPSQICHELINENYRRIELERLVLPTAAANSTTNGTANSTGEDGDALWWSNQKDKLLQPVEMRKRLQSSTRIDYIDSFGLDLSSSVTKERVEEIDGGIESARNAIHADFANKYIGGGVLHCGCVQEEIRFMLSTECLISVLLCDVMLPTEAILIRNTIQFTKYSGYAGTFACEGLHHSLQHAIDIARSSSTSCATSSPGGERLIPIDDIVAIDAIPFGNDKTKQYQLPGLLRELNKCRVGLSSQTTIGKPFATGNWGCGVFGGDAQLKSIIQWLACSVHGKKMIYYPFQDQSTENLPQLVELALSKSMSTGQMFDLLTTVLGEEKFKKKGGLIAALVAKISSSCQTH